MRGTQLAGLVAHEPRPGVGYAQVLVTGDPGFSRLRQISLGIGGAMLGLLSMITIPAMVNQSILRLAYLISGSPGSWADYHQAAITFATPVGVLAAHLGLGTLIPISLALVLIVHRFHPRWLHSVQPGFRWRFAFAGVLAAVVVLGAVWAASRIGQSWVLSPEPQIWWFLLVIVAVTPLQAAAEEYFFRGYLLQAITLAAPDFSGVASGRDGADRSKWAGWLAVQYPRWAGVIGSALIFAFMHGAQDLSLFGYRFGFGLVAGWLVVKTGGLEAGIAAHVVNNLIVFGYAAASGSMVAARTVSTATWPELLWILVGFGGFAALAVWLSRRMNLATTTPGSQFGQASAPLVK